MMKLFNHWLVIPTTLAALLTTIAPVRSETIQLAPNFTPDPLVVTGTSGGVQDSGGCGKIGAAPNVVVNLSDNFNYLRFSVESAGQPTLLIKSPNGNSCVLQGSSSGNTLEAPGFWEEGMYQIYIGDLAGEEHPYLLSITQVR
ncbi:MULTISPECIES: hypothetical protein [unclassified Coleofasciculus]|uniref:hypothetical protein n=1 Tax=unclassified Coleofasciculus TaxID=2692782 RepID=UPI001882EBBD|nr:MULTISPECIES: hypothetical protein [unclassified Coleofasciculus]MBE9126402.1 hypothetical protein [Coleofasciculus sp. LEGE 07081]MBE9149819.1 hypothetical protein [Coleofasciculus sp. LEGE 07092]